MGARKLKKTRAIDESERDSQIRQYTNLVKHISTKIADAAPYNVLREDLFQVGMVGLIHAIDQTQESLCTRYVYQRVRGEIIDSLRKEDPACRRTREGMRAIHAAEHRLNRKASSKEIASEAEMTLSEYHETLNEFHCTSPLYYEELQVDDDIDHALDYLIADESTGDPHKTFAANKLNRLISALPDRERTAFTMQYYDGNSLHEIGELMGVDQSRICQINQQTTAKLRAQL